MVAKFSTRDSEGLVLDDIRELLFIIAVSVAKGPNTWSGGKLDTFVRTRMKEEA